MTTIYTNTQRRTRELGGYFQLECDRTKERLTGYGFGDSIRLQDNRGIAWRGEALTCDSSSTVTLRSDDGRSMRGFLQGTVVSLRDRKGEVWRGYVS